MSQQFNKKISDPRSQKSYSAIRDAFVELVLKERYDEIAVGDIIKLSGVARSTFYQHFTSKEDILSRSLQPPMSCLADAIFVSTSKESINAILQHFWEKRSFCRLILQGTPGKAVHECLSSLLLERIEHLRNEYSNINNPLFLSLEPSHIAKCIASAQLSLITTWLLGQAKTSSDNLAFMLKQSSVAMLEAFQLNVKES